MGHGAGRFWYHDAAARAGVDSDGAFDYVFTTMRSRRGAIEAGVVCAVMAAGCMPEQRVEYATQSAAPSGQYLYLPASGAQGASVQSVVVQSNDGRQFTVGGGDVRAAVGGRVAVALPPGFADGTATLNVGGQALSIPFHIVASMAAAPVMGTMQVASGDPRCAALTGTWQGTIWSTQGSSATAYFQVLDDCRTVQGTISASAPSSGSVDATIDGTWDASSGTLVARDTQLFNVRPSNGTNFCETTRYEMHMSPGGELVGTNDTSNTSCGGMSPVRLYRVQ